MYLARLGQIGERDQILESAVTESLDAVRDFQDDWAAYRTQGMRLAPNMFQHRVDAAKLIANSRLSVGMSPFTDGEVSTVLTARGYLLYMPSLDLPPTATREMILDSAITEVLLEAGSVTHPLITYPNKAIGIMAGKHDRHVSNVLQLLETKLSPTMPRYKFSQVSAAIDHRGLLRAIGAPMPEDRPDPEYRVNPNDPPRILPPRERGEPGWELPIIVPPTPKYFDPPLPDYAQPSKSNLFWWIAGIAALYVLAREIPKNKNPRSGKSSRAESLTGILSGDTSNCGLWQEVESKKTGGLMWRCLKYAPACGNGKCKTPPAGTKKKARICVKSKQVRVSSPRFKKKTAKRCSKYQKICAGASCLPEPFEKPEPSPAHGANIKRMTRELAQTMADERNDVEENVGKELGREIMSQGGIRVKRPGEKMPEEFDVIPLFLRRKDGHAPDLMAQMVGFADERTLLENIAREYPKVKGKKQRRFTASEFMLDAESQVWANIDPEYFGGLGATRKPRPRRVKYNRGDDNSAINAALKTVGDKPLYIFPTAYGFDIKPDVPGWLNHYKVYPNGKVESHLNDVRTGKWTIETLKPASPKRASSSTRTKEAEQLDLFGSKDLFPVLRRELVLESQDIATSDDPLEIYLQRRGWNLKDVEELQISIAEKAVPDMFTAKTKPLTKTEIALQDEIQDFFDKQEAQRKVPKKAKRKTPPKKPVKAARLDPPRQPDFWVAQPYQPYLLGLSGMSIAAIEKGVNRE